MKQNNSFNHYFNMDAACQLKGLVHVYLLDKKHVAVNANQTQLNFLYEILGVKDTLGYSVPELFANEPQIATTICEENEQVMHSGIPKQFYNIFEFKNKYKVELLTTKLPIYGENGEIQGIFGISNYINKFSIEKAAAMGLSERETECLFHLLDGKTNIATANFMGVKLRTVEGYIERAKAKFACSTRAGLLLKALDCKIKESVKDDLCASDDC